MSRSKKIITVVIILVVLVGASAGVALLLNRPRQTEQSATDTTVNQSPVDKPAEKKAAVAEKLANTGDVEAETKMLDEAIKGTQDSHEKFVYYSRKATILLNDNKLGGAQVAAKQAFDIEQGSASAALVGQIAQQNGDTETALDYYKKAVQLIDTSDPMADEDEEFYNAQIAELEQRSNG